VSALSVLSSWSIAARGHSDGAGTSVAAPQPACANHDDGGVTAAAVACELCGPLCHDCAHFLHLSRATRAHVRSPLPLQRAQRVAVTCRDGVATASAANVHVSVYGGRLLAVVDCDDRVPAAPGRASTILCRFCDAPVTSVRLTVTVCACSLRALVHRGGGVSLSSSSLVCMCVHVCVCVNVCMCAWSVCVHLCVWCRVTSASPVRCATVRRASPTRTRCARRCCRAATAATACGTSRDTCRACTAAATAASTTTRAAACASRTPCAARRRSCCRAATRCTSRASAGSCSFAGVDRASRLDSRAVRCAVRCVPQYPMTVPAPQPVTAELAR
jgi:hypothetical protein